MNARTPPRDRLLPTLFGVSGVVLAAAERARIGRHESRDSTELANLDPSEEP
jgi:hypothetical protein